MIININLIRRLTRTYKKKIRVPPLCVFFVWVGYINLVLACKGRNSTERSHRVYVCIVSQAEEGEGDAQDGDGEGGSGPPSTSQLDQQLSPTQALQRQEQQVRTLAPLK